MNYESKSTVMLKATLTLAAVGIVYLLLMALPLILSPGIPLPTDAGTQSISSRYITVSDAGIELACEVKSDVCTEE